MNRTWLWPLSWYFRIKRLEAEVAALKEMNRKLDAQMRAEAIANTCVTSAYIASLMSMTADLQRRTNR